MRIQCLSVGRIGGEMGSIRWHTANQRLKKLKGCSKIKMCKLRLQEQSDGDLQIFRGIAFRICGTV